MCVQFVHKTATLIYAVKPPLSHLLRYTRGKGSDAILGPQDNAFFIRAIYFNMKLKLTLDTLYANLGKNTPSVATAPWCSRAASGTKCFTSSHILTYARSGVTAASFSLITFALLAHSLLLDTVIPGEIMTEEKWKNSGKSNH